MYPQLKIIEGPLKVYYIPQDHANISLLNLQGICLETVVEQEQWDAPF